MHPQIRQAVGEHQLVAILHSEMLKIRRKSRDFEPKQRVSMWRYLPAISGRTPAAKKFLLDRGCANIKIGRDLGL